MRRIYMLYCLAVLGLYAYTKVQGISFFNSGPAAPGATSSSGGHGTGLFLGSHK